MSNSNSEAVPGSSERKSPWPFNFFGLLSVAFPVALAVFLYRTDKFDPAPLPLHEMEGPAPTAAARNAQMLRGSEFVGAGALLSPEDIAFDFKTGVIYTGCADGWVKRVYLNESAADSVVENWVNTGGRPLGIAIGLNNQVLVADTEKGLLSINEDGVMELLADEAEGIKFKLTDGVDVAEEDGMIYFTDASYKYKLEDCIWDMLEGKPHGRLLSYNPATNQTKVLLRDLYFPNGVTVSPDQSSLIFCESALRRCRKYHLKGEKKGSVEPFINYLPGIPDNILYDGEGHYWIAFPSENTALWDLASRYPFIRKVIGLIVRYIGRPDFEKNGGVLAVDLEGKPISHYYDPGLSLITSGVKIGNHLYCGSLAYTHFIRLNLLDYPAHVTTT